MPITVANRMFMSSGLTKAARYGAVLWVALLFGAGFTVNATPDVETTAAATSRSGQIQTTVLEYTEVPYSFINWGCRVVVRSTPFPKEPAFGSGKIVRGALQFGDSTNNSVAFAWTQAAGKLYLDLNHNLDLTDDTAGVFACPEKNYSKSYQTFTNVHLPFKTPSGNREMLVDLNLNDYGSRPGCTVAMHSFWQGKVTLQGLPGRVHD